MFKYFVYLFVILSVGHVSAGRVYRVSDFHGIHSTIRFNRGNLRSEILDLTQDHFIREFKQREGMTPTAFSKRSLQDEIA